MKQVLYFTIILLLWAVACNLQQGHILTEKELEVLQLSEKIKTCRNLAAQKYFSLEQ